MYQQDCTRFFSTYGLSHKDLEPMTSRLEFVRDAMVEAYRDSSLALLHLPEKRDDLEDLEVLAQRLEGFKEVVILGTGGSSLGGQTLAQFAGHMIAGTGHRVGPKLTFLDNLDPESLAGHLASPDLTERHYVAISKSGTTSETLMQTMAVMAALKQAGQGSRLSSHISAITEPATPDRKAGLRALVESFGGTVLDHHTGIGGRYTCLTNVGLLPARLAGLNIVALRQGAMDVVTSLLSASDSEDCPALYGAALMQALSEKSGVNASVMIAYGDRMKRLTAWYAQLWAESLGKEGKGTAPIAAQGPVDQHSQLQLFLDGPLDKAFTLISYDWSDQGPVMSAELAALAGADGLSERSVGELVSAQVLAVRDALAQRGRPVRHIYLPRNDEHAFGGLLMHFMLETIMAGYLMGVDPLDQPAVEEAKILTRAYLNGKTR